MHVVIKNGYSLNSIQNRFCVIIMDMMGVDEELSKAAIRHMRQKEILDGLIARFCDSQKYPADSHPISVFMAGSPGAGKTEFSKNLLKIIGVGVIRIDPDEVRNLIPQYTGSNAHLFQYAVNIGVDKIFYHALAHNQNFILDGTMANFSKAYENIERTLKQRDFVEIFYLFQDPVIAWDFTKKRELVEHRNITKGAFIKSFFGSKETVTKIKEAFKDKIKLNLVVKNFTNNQEDFKKDIEKIDSHLKQSYTIEELERTLL